MPRQIQGSQTDFSFGEVDPDLKRNDGHPARKGGLRQMSNARIHNSGTIQNRSGRSALYPISGGPGRIERIIMSAGNIFDLAFSTGSLKIIDSAGTVVASFNAQGNGAALPWSSQADMQSIVYAVLNFSIYICFGHTMVPQVVTWDGVSVWAAPINYAELVQTNKKLTVFYRLSPQGVAIQPSAQTGSVTVVAVGGAPFTNAHLGTRIRFVGRQLLITAFADSQHVTATVEENLPGSQQIGFAIDPISTYSIGDEVKGSITNSVGVITDINSGTKVVTIQLLSTSTQTVTSPDIFSGPQTTVVAFIVTDTVVGPGGGLIPSTVSGIQTPQATTVWDDELMNPLRGYPASVFTDQFRLGFCDFLAVPGGIGWSSINAPNNFYIGANPSDAIFEIAPAKVRVYYTVAGPEGSEFVFTDRGVFYIPISETNPLKPGSVAFKRLTGDGAARVQPRLAQEAIIYVNAGGSSLVAIIATGAFLRPFNTKSLSDYHAHLFDNIQSIAAPSADGTFNERYAYVLNGDGSITVGKYYADSLAGNAPVVGWGPWSGAGTVKWIAASGQDVLFTSSYFGVGICEILDDTVYMDAALVVNALPAPFTPPGGKGPLWWIPSQSVFLMDQVSRPMGLYQIDANGFIIPQNNGGENLAAASLVAGQIWSGMAEPFAPDATPGADMKQRMELRQYSKYAVYVIHSTGLVLAQIFSSKQTRTSPVPGVIERTQRVPAYNLDDDTTVPPFQRETVESWTPVGSSYDPRVAVVWDTPGPIQILEFAMEIST